MGKGMKRSRITPWFNTDDWVRMGYKLIVLGCGIGRKDAMKKSRINPISAKQKAELALRAKLSLELTNEQHGLCSVCHQIGDWRGLHLAHEIPLARGGKTTKENCSMKCAKCHAVKDHGIKEVESETDWASYWD